MDKMLMNGLNDQTIAVIEEAIEKVLGKEHVTLTIRSRTTGELLYTYRGDHLMRPASNMKLLSGAAALATIGADYRFQTKIYRDGSLENGVLTGNVYLQGTGDATIVEADLQRFAQLLKANGIKQIKGQLIADESYFTGDTLPPGVCAEDETYYYGARVSAVTMSPNSDFDASTIVVTVTPQKLGDSPAFTVMPHLCGMTIKNEAQTVAVDEEMTLEVLRTKDTGEIRIVGNLPLNETAKVWVSMQNPAMNTLTFWQAICVQEGIEFLQKHAIAIGQVPETAQLLHTNESCTVGELFSIFMKLSNNSIADIFTKTMGKITHGVGNYEEGIRVIKDYLYAQHVAIDDWKFVDGSGMSHQIRVSSNGLSKLLFELQKEPYFDIFVDSLPVAGNPNRLIGGTLNDRFVEPEFEGRIVAKTGFISEVNALSGYLVGESGEPYIFSLLLEGYEEGIPVLDSGLKRILSVL